MSYLFHFIIVSLQKIGGTSAIQNKFYCARLALSLQKIGGTSAIQNKFYCTRLALSLQKIGGMGAMSREIPGADKDG